MELEFRFDTKRCLHTTQVFKLKKAVEHLYYFSLLTGSPKYAINIAGGEWGVDRFTSSPSSSQRVGRTISSIERLWASWVKMGFSTSLVEGPPEVARTDRVRTETQPEARYTIIRAESSTVGAIKTIEQVLVGIDTLRSHFQNQDDSSRLQVLVGDSKVVQTLVDPVKSTLTQISLRSFESERVVEALYDCLIWVTDNDIVGITSKESVANPAPALIGTVA